MGITELADLVRAGLDEDERIAQVCLGVNAVAAMKHGIPAPRWVANPTNSRIDDTQGIPRVKFAWPRERQHILRHDPARVLADVVARRRLLDEALGWDHYEVEDAWYSCPASQAYRKVAPGPYPCECGRDERVLAVLTLLAKPYQDGGRD